MGYIDLNCKNCGSKIRVNTDSPSTTCEVCHSTFNIYELFGNTNSNFSNQNNFPQNNASNFNNPNQLNSNMGLGNFNQQPQEPVNNINQMPQEPINIMGLGNINPSNGFESLPNLSNIEPGVMNNEVFNNTEPPVNNNPVNNVVNNNTPNVNNGKPKKKKKKNTKKIILYIFFSLLMIGSGILWYIDSQRKPEPDDNELFEPLPSEIMTEEKDLIETPIEASVIKLAPDINIPYERQYYNNNDIIGRLEIPNLINTLVVKGTDNHYYLSHSIRKENDIRGTEFIDFRNTPTDQQVNVYGHNTRDIRIQVSFLKLEKFLDPTFFNENPYVVFQYEGGKRLYKILAMKEVYETNLEHMDFSKKGQAFVEHVKNMTTGEGVINYRSDVTYDENSEIIVLQTCSHHWDNAFYTIIAVKIQDMY